MYIASLCHYIERPRTSNPRSCYMASFTTRERLIKLYTEHGYVSPTPKKFVPRRRTRKKKKTLSQGVQDSSKKTLSQVTSGVSSTQTLTGKSNTRNTASYSRPKKASTHRARKAITKKKGPSGMFSFIKVKSAGSQNTPVVAPKITAMPSPSLNDTRGHKFLVLATAIR